MTLNGTSSVLYGTIFEFASREKRTHAFAIFYTGALRCGSDGAAVSGFVGDAVGLPIALSIVPRRASGSNRDRRELDGHFVCPKRFPSSVLKRCLHCLGLPCIPYKIARRCRVRAQLRPP